MGYIVKTIAGKNELKAGVPSVFPWVRTSPREGKEPTVRNMDILIYFSHAFSTNMQLVICVGNDKLIYNYLMW